jgi:hypothetical protein
VSERKSRMVSMRITETQFQHIQQIAREIRESTGFRITRASIMLKLMEYGLPKLQEQVIKEFETETPKSA